jgi:hypothetical protein
MSLQKHCQVSHDGLKAKGPQPWDAGAALFLNFKKTGGRPPCYRVDSRARVRMVTLAGGSPRRQRPWAPTSIAPSRWAPVLSGLVVWPKLDLLFDGCKSPDRG